MKYLSVLIPFISFFIFPSAIAASNITAHNVAEGKKVTADSQEESASKAVDADHESYWQSAASIGDHWLEIDLEEKWMLDHIVISKISGVDSLIVSLWCEGQWQTVFAGKPDNPLIGFEPAKARKVQLKSIQGKQVRIYEVAVFQYDPQPVFVNQSGYDLHRSKRFTAPKAKDDTPFIITTAESDQVLFEGTVKDKVGDLTAFQPEHPGPYVVHVQDETSEGISVPFNISPNLIEKVSYQPAIDFMVDVRCWFGDSRNYKPTDENADCPNLGVAWRDSHQFSFEIPSLLNLYFANPAAFSTERMPVQGVYLGVREELSENTPEIIRLIYWAVDIYLRGQVNQTLLKEQLAYFLYAYPSLSEYIPKNVYTEARDYLFGIWGEEKINRWQWYDIEHSGNLFHIFTELGTGKGQFPPGHSIVPNLMMYEVAKREGRKDAEQFLKAAYAQTEWLIQNLDWQDPRTTKGQRQGEHLTLTGMVYFLKNYPRQAPKGLEQKIAGWAETAISRADNMWDYRRYSDQKWIIPGIDPEHQSATGFNEPGNVAGFPAPALAAASVIRSKATQHRLEELAAAHIDHVFGRNPTGRHFCFDAPLDFEGVELGWFQEFQGGAGLLQTARGVLDGSPKETTYPYHPQAGDPGHTEGWVTFNTAWNTGLAYWSSAGTAVKVMDASFSNEISKVKKGGSLGIEVVAPLDFNENKIEVGLAFVYMNGEKHFVPLQEVSASSRQFRGIFQLSETMEVKQMKVAYGYGWHAREQTIDVEK